MENLDRKQNILNELMPVLLLAGVAFATIIIFYGVDSVAPGVHDTFHDFRHVTGMACH